MKVKLAKGRLLRDPNTKMLMDPNAEREVPDTDFYWRRRLRDGDAVLVGDPPAGHAEGHHGRHARSEG